MMNSVTRDSTCRQPTILLRGSEIIVHLALKYGLPICAGPLERSRCAWHTGECQMRFSCSLRPRCDKRAASGRLAGASALLFYYRQAKFHRTGSPRVRYHRDIELRSVPAHDIRPPRLRSTNSPSMRDHRKCGTESGSMHDDAKPTSSMTPRPAISCLMLTSLQPVARSASRSPDRAAFWWNRQLSGVP